MKKLLCLTIAFGLLFSFQSNAAEYAANLDIDRIRVGQDGTYFGVTPAPANTCSSWGEQFKFDHTTETGKSHLSMLIAAKVANLKIQLWYSSSTASGTNQSNGCTSTTISSITIVALQ